MKGYISPTAELIIFENDMRMYLQSGCDCQWSGYDNVVNVEDPNYDEDCTASSGHASENPYSIDAPAWGNAG